jgi:hypothetical protein
MKIPIRGFLVISAHSPYPDSRDFLIGGVAKSAAHERAAEEDGIVVELTGYYEKEDLQGLLQDRIEDYKAQLAGMKLTVKETQTLQDQIKYYEELLTRLASDKLDDFTNVAHFSAEELARFIPPNS